MKGTHFLRKETMRKKPLLVALLSLGLLVSCGETPAESSKAPESSKPTTSSTASGSKSSSTPAASSSTPAASSSTPAAQEHEHTWAAGTKTGKVTPETCGTEHKAYKLGVADAEGWNDPATKMNGKPSATMFNKGVRGTGEPTAKSCSTWAIGEGELPAGTYDIQIIGKMSYDSHSNRTWGNQYANDTAETPDTEAQDDYRYFLQAGEDFIMPNVTETWGELGFQGGESAEMKAGYMAKGVHIGEISTLKLHHGNIGYSFIIESVRLILKTADPVTPVEKSFAPAAVTITTEADKPILKITGTMAGYKAAEAKMAFGLKHKEGTGVVDALAGEWLTGKETPEAADYTIVPTITGNNFEVKIDLSTITFVKGGYEMYLGPQGGYAAIDLEQSDYLTESARCNGLKPLIRGDLDLLVMEELPPVDLAEATTLLEGEGESQKVILKIGGELGGVTATEFEALTIKVTCERQVGGWKKTAMAAEKVTKVVDGTKAYIKIDVTDLDEGGYQVKIGFDGSSEPNTALTCESFDGRTNPTVLGYKAYAAYFAAGTDDAAHLYGCAGLFIEHKHNTVRPETKVGESDLYKLTCASSCSTPMYELDAVDCEGKNNPTIGSGNTEKATRLGNADSDVWDITGIQAGEYEVQLEAAVKSDTYWNAKVAIDKGDTASNNGNATTDTMRYSFQAGTDEKVEPTMEIGAKKYTETGLKTNTRGFSNVLCKIMIKEGETSFKVTAGNVGYSMWIFGVRLTRVGDYVAPAIKLTQDTTRIEAEDSHIASRSNAGTVTAKGEDAAVSGESYVKDLTTTSNWGQTSTGSREYHVKALAAASYKLKIAYKCETTSGAAFQLVLDGGQAMDVGAQAAEWTVFETPAFELTAGEHTAVIKGIKNVKVSIDYLELVKQAATPAA